MSEDVRELLAAYAHKSWSGWMKYLFGKSIDLSSGAVVIPGKLVKRWKRQIATPYAELPEFEKESDRAEADKMLESIGYATLTRQLAEAREERDKWKRNEGYTFDRLKDVEGKLAEANSIIRRLADACTSSGKQLTAATERAEKAERALAVHDDMAEARVRRLTAEVEEWKKKAEKLENDVAFADGFATAAGQRNVRLTAELSRLRRESVRVDVLLRWMFFSGTVELARYELVYPEQDSDCPLSPLPPSQPPTQEEQR